MSGIFPKYFDGQGKNEKVLFYGREHWCSFLLIMAMPIFATWLVMGVICVFVGWVGSMQQWRTLSIGCWAGIGISTLCVVGFFGHYYRDSAYIITNIRMRKHVREGIFAHQIKEIALHKVDEVLYTSRGIAAKIWNFGTVNGGSKTEMLIVYFRGVARAKQVANYLSRLCAHIREQPSGDITAIQPFIPKHKRRLSQ